MATSTTPRRGGKHPIYGIFVGGSDLDDNYRLTGTRHYKFTAQRRGPKVINSIEQALLSTIASKDADKFDGNLEKNQRQRQMRLTKVHS